MISSFICKWEKLNALQLINNYEQRAPGLQKELFSPRGSLIRVFLEPPSSPRFLRETPWLSSRGGMALLHTGGHWEGGRNLDVPH